MQHASLVRLDTLVHIVWNVSAFLQIVGIAHEFARHIHGHVATADHGDFLSVEWPLASAGRITVVPFHKLGCAIHAIQVGARQSKLRQLKKLGEGLGLGTAARIDLFEKLPVPFGLVRYGVAPDHPSIKFIASALEKTLDNPDIHLYCDVEFGKDVTLDELLERAAREPCSP